jgi:hypothetical protein
MEIQLNTPKEVTEVGIALSSILKAVSLSLKDGFQPGQDIPAIVMSAIASLGNAIEGIENLPEEFKSSPVMATMGILAPVSEGVEALINLKDEN